MNPDEKPEKKKDTPFVEGGVYSKMEQSGTVRITGMLVASNLPIRNGVPGKRTGRMVMASFTDDQVDEGGKLNQWTLESVPVPVEKDRLITETWETLCHLQGEVHALRDELAAKRPPAASVEVLERVAREAVAVDFQALVRRVEEALTAPRTRADDDDDYDGEEHSEEVEDVTPPAGSTSANPIAALQAARARAAG